MIDVKQMRITEENSEYYKVPKIELMENAGKAIAENIKKDIKGKKAIVFASHGNNGGDGLVAARHLHDWGAKVDLYLFGQRAATDSNLKLVRERSITYVDAVQDVADVVQHPGRHLGHAGLARGLDQLLLSPL